MSEALEDLRKQYRLPCDVTIGSTVFAKGVRLETLINAAKRWNDMAYCTVASPAPDYNAMDEEMIPVIVTALIGTLKLDKNTPVIIDEATEVWTAIKAKLREGV